MYFSEMINNCNTENVIHLFLEMCTNSPDINVTEDRIRSAVSNMTALKPILDNDKVLKIEKEQTDDGSYDAVYLFDTKENKRYGIEINPWADTLGYVIDPASLEAYGMDRFTALVLWEMTWFGYSEDIIQEKVKSWDVE